MALRALPAFRGELLQPGDPSYDEHRKVWNGSIDRSPAAIARCASTQEVVDAVGLARESGLPTAVKGGGHSFPGASTCDGGIVIDLSKMKGIEIDPERRTARVEGGVLLGELDGATQEHGLAVPAGIVTHTGVAGLTLGGGIGWVQRKYGLTIDQLLSARPRTRTSSGGCGAAAATSASSPTSSSGSTPWVRQSWPGRSSGRWRIRLRCFASIATGSPMLRTS